MKGIVYLTFAFIFLPCFLQDGLTQASKNWQLVFQDEFNATGSFDTATWSYCKRIQPAWGRYLTQSPDYVFCEDGNLVLKMDNKKIAGDDVPYHSAGIETLGKCSFKYGKVEVRAKFTGGRGSWPAIWMMPEKDVYGGWPNSGEIDIMEHVNNEEVIHHTIHNAAVTGAEGGSTAIKSTAYNADGYNLYGITWTSDKIEFYTNNTLIYAYHKAVNATSRDWPFDQPFYLILNQSGGAGWPGAINDAGLPFTMQVDWVKVYKEKEQEK
ncbi:MAG TPA: glycoside hydrolase family 16 protein [Parafilimonas sp.]|nr:glycoside hydrolase family 16 protein [Parafilimonas sp.]